MIKRLSSMLLASALAFTVVACGGKSESSTTPPGGGETETETEAETATGPTCADAGANVKIQLGTVGELQPAQVDQAAEVLVASCNEDGWSPEAVKCVAESNAEQIENCKTMMSADVSAKLDARMEEIFDGHGGGGDEE